MRQSLAVLAACLVAASASAADGPSKLLIRFDGALPMDPSTATLSTAGVVGVVPNVVRGVTPGGRPWVLRKFDASIGRDGSIKARGKGLLISSGDPIGTRGAVALVGATLFCGAADATATRFSTLAGSALDTFGNFEIRGKLSTDGINTAVMPDTCTNPVLLVRSYSATTNTLGAWFAAGIPSDGDD